MVYMAYACVWLACALAAWKLDAAWIMILPLFVSMSVKKKDKGE